MCLGGSPPQAGGWHTVGTLQSCGGNEPETGHPPTAVQSGPSALIRACDCTCPHLRALTCLASGPGVATTAQGHTARAARSVKTQPAHRPARPWLLRGFRRAARDPGGGYLSLCRFADAVRSEGREGTGGTGWRVLGCRAGATVQWPGPPSLLRQPVPITHRSRSTRAGAAGSRQHQSRVSSPRLCRSRSHVTRWPSVARVSACALGPAPRAPAARAPGPSPGWRCCGAASPGPGRAEKAD